MEIVFANLGFMTFSPIPNKSNYNASAPCNQTEHVQNKKQKKVSDVSKVKHRLSISHHYIIDLVYQKKNNRPCRQIDGDEYPRSTQEINERK